MDVSSVSTASSTMLAEWKARQQQMQTDMANLGQALGSGDVTAAEKAISDIESLKPKDAKSSTTRVNPMEKDLAALEKALQSGDLAAAKDAFATLKAGFEKAGKQHGHHGPPPTQGAQSNDVYQTLLDALNGSSSSQSSDSSTSSSDGLSVLLGSSDTTSASNSMDLNSLLKLLANAGSTTSSTNTDSSQAALASLLDVPA